MDRKKPKIDHRKIRGIETYSYGRIKEFCSIEVEPIIKMLPDKKLEESFRQSLKKYLIITLITSLEHFFRSEGKSLVDKNDMDITRLFSGEMSFSLSDLDRMQKDGTLTKGNIVASNFGFGNLDDINHVFSTLLHLDFLDYIHKLNDINQTRYVLDGHPILIDYAKLKEAYRMRNEIVHGLKNPKISNWGILSMWDNIMNIMDISGSIFLSAAEDLRSSLDADYQWGIEREKKKRIYQLYSEQIINLLTEKGQIQLLQDGKLNNLFLDGIRVKNDDDILTDNINWIIRKMLRRKLIRILNNNVSLAPIGINRSKKLQKSSNTLSKKGH